MKMNRTTFFATFLGVLLLMLIMSVGVYLFIRKEAPSPAPQAFADVPLSGGRQQCVGVNCYTAPPNMDCINHGDWCETIIMGFVADDDFAVFNSCRVMKLNSLMTKAGVGIGDTVTNINDQHPESELKFAELVLKMGAGMRLRIIRANGEQVEVVL